MVVLEPLKITITNFPESNAIDISVPNFPNDATKGSHNVKFDRVIYIEKNDFHEAEEAGYKRLTPNQSVGLRHAGYVISVKEVVKNSSGEIIELKVTCESVNTAVKPKAFIHWVSNPITISVRMYDRL